MSASPRRKRLRHRPAVSAVAALVAAVALLLALPLTSLGASPSLGSSLGGLLSGVTTTLQTTVQHVLAPSHAGTAARPSSAPASATPAASAPAASSPSYTPPMYGTNPHGQGTVASLGLNSSSGVPYNYAPGGSSAQGEQLVLGRGRSEQNSNGTYDAQTTIIGLFGNDLIPESATTGQTKTGPLDPVQTGILNALCTNTSGAICLTLLAADDSATTSGAKSHFQLAGLTSKQILGLGVNAASSDSSINTTNTCQTSSGSSSVAGLSLASGEVASVGKSSESSTACAGQSPSQTASSSVIGLAGTGVGLPAPGCADGTANTEFGLLAPILPIWCNADSTLQAATPAGVREALTVLGLQGSSSSLAKVTAAAAESHAVAPKVSSPPGGTGTPPGSGSNPSGGKKPKCSDGDHDCGIGANGQPEACVNGADPDGDGDCTAGTTPSGSASCTDGDGDCGIGPNGQRETCVNGTDPDGDGDCANTTEFASEVTSAKASSLPFTGENVLEVILIGLVLVGGGTALSMRSSAAKKQG